MKPGEISFSTNVSSAWPVLSRQTGKAAPEEPPSQAGDGITVSGGSRRDNAAPSLADMQKAFLAQSVSDGGNAETVSGAAACQSEEQNKPAVSPDNGKITSASSVPSVPIAMFQEDDTLSLYTPPEKSLSQEAPAPAETGQLSAPSLFMDDQGSGFDVLLQPVADDKKQYGLSMQPSCACGRMNSLRDRVKAELEADLPTEYEEFLANTNGLDFDGLVFYGSEPGPIAGYDDRMLDGVIEANQCYRENGSMKKMLVLGESEDLLYVFDSQRSTYHAVDSTSLKKCEHYTSFKEMLAGALVSRM